MNFPFSNSQDVYVQSGRCNEIHVTQPLTETGHIDEFVVGCKETGHVGRGYGEKKNKMVYAVELADLRKANSLYNAQQCTHYRTGVPRILLQIQVAAP